MSDPDDDELIHAVEFKPGWPDIVLHGLIVARSRLAQSSPEDDEDTDEDDEVEWTLHLGFRDSDPKLAMLGDLVVRNSFGSVGVTVILPFDLRKPPQELTADVRDNLLLQYGEWVSSVMYDHAATVARTALAGNGLALDVPYGTPPVDLHTSAVDKDR